MAEAEATAGIENMVMVATETIVKIDTEIENRRTLMKMST